MRILNKRGMDLRFVRLADLMSYYHPPPKSRRARLWARLWSIVLGLAMRG